jgi:hypothetical protein
MEKTPNPCGNQTTIHNYKPLLNILLPWTLRGPGLIWLNSLRKQIKNQSVEHRRE